MSPGCCSLMFLPDTERNDGADIRHQRKPSTWGLNFSALKKRMRSTQKRMTSSLKRNVCPRRMGRREWTSTVTEREARRERGSRERRAKTTATEGEEGRKETFAEGRRARDRRYPFPTSGGGRHWRLSALAVGQRHANDRTAGAGLHEID
jgi:hypothetical protein